MSSVSLTVMDPAGIHARTAAHLARTAAPFASIVRARNLSRGGDAADCRSILSVLGLAATLGHVIELSADGPDAEEALLACAAVFDAEP